MASKLIDDTTFPNHFFLPSSKRDGANPSKTVVSSSTVFVEATCSSHRIFKVRRGCATSNCQSRIEKSATVYCLSDCFNLFTYTHGYHRGGKESNRPRGKGTERKQPGSGPHTGVGKNSDAVVFL